MVNKFVKLQIWDTAGQERFRCVLQLFICGVFLEMCFRQVWHIYLAYSEIRSVMNDVLDLGCQIVEHLQEGVI